MKRLFFVFDIGDAYVYFIVHTGIDTVKIYASERLDDRAVKLPNEYFDKFYEHCKSFSHIKMT